MMTTLRAGCFFEQRKQEEAENLLVEFNAYITKIKALAWQRVLEEEKEFSSREDVKQDSVAIREGRQEIKHQILKNNYNQFVSSLDEIQNCTETNYSNSKLSTNDRKNLHSFMQDFNILSETLTCPISKNHTVNKTEGLEKVTQSINKCNTFSQTTSRTIARAALYVIAGLAGLVAGAVVGAFMGAFAGGVVMIDPIAVAVGAMAGSAIVACVGPFFAIKKAHSMMDDLVPRLKLIDETVSLKTTNYLQKI